MDIWFICKTNKDYITINTAKFKLPSGAVITVDRTETIRDRDYHGNIGNMKMVWKNAYLWALDGFNIFGDKDGYGLKLPRFEASEFRKLVAGTIPATVSFELECEADEDYECECLMFDVVCEESAENDNDEIMKSLIVNGMEQMPSYYKDRIKAFSERARKAGFDVLQELILTKTISLIIVKGSLGISSIIFHPATELEGMNIYDCKQGNDESYDDFVERAIDTALHGYSWRNEDVEKLIAYRKGWKERVSIQKANVKTKYEKSDDLQWVRKVNDHEYDLVEVREHIPGSFIVVSGNVDLSIYTDEEFDDEVRGYYKNLAQVKEQYPDNWQQVVCECIFEQIHESELICSGPYDSEDAAEEYALSYIKLQEQS